jgi:Protein kinase domain
MKFSSTSSHRQLHSSTRIIFVFLQIALLFIFIAIPSTASASSSYKFLVLDTPPTQQNVARAGVSVVRLVASYTAGTGKAGQQPVVVQCTGLGALVASWPGSNDQNNWILTDGSLVNGSITKNTGSVTCGNVSGSGKLSALAIFLSAAYHANQAPIQIGTTGLQSEVFCQNTTNCSQGAALLAFNDSTLFPYADLPAPTTSNSQPTGIGIGLTRNSNSSDVPTPSNNNAQHNPQYAQQTADYLTPHLIAANNASIEPGTPLVDTNGSLVSMHLSANSTLTAADIRSFMQTQPALQHIPQNLVHDNWNSGITDFYQHRYAQAHNAFQQVAKTNPQFQGANDFAQFALSQQNASHTAARSTSVGGFKFLNFFLPYWLLSIAGLLLLTLLLLITPWLVGRFQQRRRHFSTIRIGAIVIISLFLVLALGGFNLPIAFAFITIAILVGSFDTLNPKKIYDGLIGTMWPNALQKIRTLPLPGKIEPKQPISAISSIEQDKLPASPIAPMPYQSPSLPCPRCHESVRPGAKFCPNCRLPLSQETPQPAQNEPSPLLNSISMPAKAATAPVPPWWQKSMPPASMEQPQKNQPDLSSSYNQPQPQNNKSESHNIEIPPDKPGRTGQRLGSYRLISLLGHGGFADVYLGEHVFLHTQAAIKVLQIRLTSRVIKDFLEEARTIAGLTHPHIVRILDFGMEGKELDLDQSMLDVADSTPFLIMDYAPRGTLRNHHPKGSRLPLTTIVPYVQQIASALQYAHEKKRIHRDVKPENMLIGQNNDILLSDFGISVVAHSDQSISTQEMAGTLAYIAPEQIRGKPRLASDQYALGIVVYEWLSGTRPFLGTTSWEIMNQHLSVEPPRLKEKVPSISPAVEEVVMKAISKDPHQRFESVQAFADALLKVAPQ